MRGLPDRSSGVRPSALRGEIPRAAAKTPSSFSSTGNSGRSAATSPPSSHESEKKNDALWNGLDLIVPVPLHARRARERGFNQAGVLARELGKLRGIPVETGVLRKVRNAPPQTSLERAGRRTSVRGAYRAARPERVRGRTVLLVDDVYTTGSTLRECAAVLAAAGAKEIRAVTVAQA